MAEAAAAAAERAIMERVRNFKFDRYDHNAEDWTYYIQRFETELALHGLKVRPDDIDTQDLRRGQGRPSTLLPEGRLRHC